MGISLLNEAEIHGLVDGHVDVDRRADLLRRLAGSTQDRALVEAWQEQSDLIRSAFREVEREPLPMSLDLAPPRLRCIDGSSFRPAEPRLESAPVDHRRSGLAAAATLLVVTIGLVATWLMIVQVGRDDDPDAGSRQTSLEAMLADRAAAAVDAAGTTVGSKAVADGGLAPVRLPDLTTSGFMLTDVSTQPGAPRSLVLRYSDGADGRLALTIARTAADAAPSAPATIGRSFSWRRRNAAFAIAGTLPPDRLRAIAATLQNDAGY